MLMAQRLPQCARYCRPACSRQLHATADSEWLEAVFNVEPKIGILKPDDYSEENYATDRVQELVGVVHAYLRGDGTIAAHAELDHDKLMVAFTAKVIGPMLVARPRR